MVKSRRVYTKEEEKFIKSIYKKYTSKVMTEMFNKKFSDRPINNEQMKGKIRSMKLKKGKKFSGFKKGNIPWNKGVKAEEYMSGEWLETFNKHKIKGFRKPGDIYKNYNGKYLIRTEDGSKETTLQRFMYEMYHGVKLKSFERVILLDGDDNNLTIENLISVNVKDIPVMAHEQYFTEDRELTKLGAAVAKARRVIKETEKRKNND